MRSTERFASDSDGAASTDAVERAAEALAFVGSFLLSSRLRTRKSAIKVRGGRARARSASRDERGRFVAD